ncbi:hypothetical protein Y032_0071g583 [Ancylostoma ceylanicum]|uniref:MARVEL domain-containing protein n=1 Tax=Ancylostoma ceylanicum TaxID=53326 RepID=A0A016TWW3_9BILA|nr:hypothetical protein Y032_0071g583 [Ancylostoma ceylanicum]
MKWCFQCCIIILSLVIGCIAVLEVIGYVALYKKYGVFQPNNFLVLITAILCIIAAVCGIIGSLFRSPSALEILASCSMFCAGIVIGSGIYDVIMMWINLRNNTELWVLIAATIVLAIAHTITTLFFIYLAHVARKLAKYYKSVD